MYRELLEKRYAEYRIPYILEYIDVLSDEFDEAAILTLVSHKDPVFTLYDRVDFDKLNIASYAFCDFDDIKPSTKNKHGFYKSKDGKYVLEQNLF